MRDQGSRTGNDGVLIQGYVTNFAKDTRQLAFGDFFLKILKSISKPLSEVAKCRKVHPGLFLRKCQAQHQRYLEKDEKCAIRLHLHESVLNVSGWKKR